MKTPQKKWHVIKCTVDFVVPKKGNNDVYLSFNETNTKFEEATGDKKARPADTHYVIFYGAVNILESEPAKAGKFPEEWWKKEGPLMEDSPPETAKPVAATTGVAEFDVIRRTFEQQLRAQAWRVYEQSANELRTKYVAALERAMKTSQTAGRLDEALELRQEKETVGQTGKVSDQAGPASTPALITLRATHQIALIGLKEARDKSAAPILAAYNQKTALLIQQLTQAGRLDAAKEVRDAKDSPLIADE